MEVQWRFGDMRDLGTWGTDPWWQPDGCHGPCPTFPKHTGSGAHTRTWGHGHHPWGGELVPWCQVALQCAMWHHVSRMLETLHPLHCRCPVLSESLHVSPSPGLVPHPSGHGTVPLFTRTWAQGPMRGHRQHGHGVGTVWHRHSKKAARACRWQSCHCSVGGSCLVGMTWV